MNENFVDFMRKYSGHKLAVAVSGGVDSVCLVCWLAAMGLDIVALHVNHGLRAVADDEEQYVQDLCKKLNVPCQTFRWCGEKPANGIEAAARDIHGTCETVRGGLQRYSCQKLKDIHLFMPESSGSLFHIRRDIQLFRMDFSSSFLFLPISRRILLPVKGTGTVISKILS